MEGTSTHSLASSNDGHVDKSTHAKDTSEEMLEPLTAAEIYYNDNGLQRIKPYFYEFSSYAKGRWVGRTIYEVFCSEFRGGTPAYYETAIKRGIIRLNNENVGPSTIVRNGDLITHFIHRHEPPVTTQPLVVVCKTDDGLLVVDKPASIPVHPGGQFNYNSAIKLLEIKHGYHSLFPINRLDRLTSGLMLIGLNSDVARRLEHDLLAHRIQKEYICRVKGVFPGGRIVCDQPMRVVAHRLGLSCVDCNEGKPSLTEFELLAVDDDKEHSIVYCRPKTGRTHQIRVHLQFLGFPIANDPLYCNREVWGDSMGKNGALPETPKKGRKGEGALPFSSSSSPPVDASIKKPNKMAGLVKSGYQNVAWAPLVQRMEEWLTSQDLVEKLDVLADADQTRLCGQCAAPHMADPAPSQLCIWLHAWRYSGPGWSYETKLPGWAQQAAQYADRIKYKGCE
ncbi:DRAP deaminase [Coemansia sp. RSA 2320]|nr:DRAP deaminase [Coemansia sp. RSA 2320]